VVSNQKFWGVLFCAAVVYVVGMRLDVMEVDAAQYAEMSWEMFTTGNFFQVFNLGQPYLDKPPLLFWLNSLSFFLLGIGNFSYKLPSVLFVALAVFSTYRLARLYYTEDTARLSAIVLATTQAAFLITNDVRTDTLLMGAVAFSIWQWASFFEQGKTKHLLWGSVGVGLALLAKGPIGVIATGAAIVPHLVLKKQWRKLFDLRLLITLIIVATMLLPMCMGLYQQWGTKGLRFFFWTQSFGRITGESEWNNHPDSLFLVHSSAWAIAPWTFFFFTAWLTSLYGLLKMRFVSWSRKEFISISGFTLVIIALSLSKYQLPHYIFVVFPLAAIMVGEYLFKMQQNTKQAKVFSVLQLIACAVLVALGGFLQYAFMEGNIWSLIALTVVTGAVAVVFIKRKDVILLSTAGIIGFNLLLNTFYFPAILKYQPAGDFGRYIKQNKDAETGFAMYHFVLDFSTAFYSQEKDIPMIWNFEDLKKFFTGHKKLLLISDAYGLEELQQNGQPYEIIEERSFFRVARMNIQFLLPATRNEVCPKVYLIRLTKNQ
jgi:4-amino-4-deoxy-L-arabinose transferase-like glycosyltransferase